MNQTGHGYSRGFLIAMLASAFLFSSETALWASPAQSSQSQSGQSSSSQPHPSQPQSSQPGTTGQKADDSLPDAPQSQSVAAAQSQQPATAPSGAAGAKAADVKGSPVAQPVGAAVAPVRQHGHRSLLIKLGLVAGAGIAVGSAVALSERSPSRPPGAAAVATRP
jgi:hypothetical protein